MSKFKVGDKVKIIKPRPMDSVYKDKIVTIEEIDFDADEVNYSLNSRYLVIENDRPWVDDELELFEESIELCGKNLFDGATWKNDFYEKYILGVWGKEEEKEMNKVLNLWFERKQEKIIKKYAEMEQDFINNHYSVVKSYNELVEQFEKDLDDLYKFDKVNEQFVLEEISDKNTIKYDIDFDKLSCEFTDKHIKEKQGELKELAKIREEVEAQLSLSNELKHQQEVLIQYNIIDKKTKKIVE